MTDEKTDDFGKQLDEGFARAWRFDQETDGPRVIGTITMIGSARSKDYGSYPVLEMEVEPDAERVAVHCFHEALISKLNGSNPKIGERIGIIQKGERESGGGNVYVDYHVAVDRKRSATTFREAIPSDIRRAADEATKEGETPELPF